MSRSTRRNLATLACLFLFAPSAWGAEPTRAVLRVTVNTVDQGDQFLELTETGDVLITAEQLWRLGLRLAEPPDSSQAKVSLRSLAPRVRFELDESAATVRLTVAPEYLPQQEPDRVTPGRSPPLLEGGSVAFLNYQASQRFSDNPRTRAWSFPLEAGMRAWGGLGLSTFNATSGPQGRAFIRLNSSVVHDDSRHVRRIVLGDLLAQSGRLGGTRSLGGIQVASNFALDRTFVITPPHEVEGALETPSDVDVYVNGVLVRRDHLQPGPFRYSSLPLPTGLGSVSLTIRDAFGRERTIAVPFYQSPDFLKPGLAEYSWSLGFARRGLGLRSFDYGELMLLGTHRVGLSETTTLGIGIESNRSTQVVSPSILWAVGSLGAIRGVIAGSRDPTGNGAGGGLSFVRNGRRFAGDLSVEGYSSRYVTLASRLSTDRLRLGWNLGLGATTRSAGSLSLRLSRTAPYDRPLLEKASLSWTRGVGYDLTLVIGINGSRDPRRAIASFAALNLQMGSLRSAGISLNHEAQSERATITLQQGTPVGTGIGYQLQTSPIDQHSGKPGTASMAATTFQGEHGQLSAHLSSGAGASSWDVNVAGSVAWIGHGVFLSRPISDGFALVRVGSILHVPVLLENRRIGSTSRHGTLLVPDLASNSESRISLDPGRIPIDWGLTEIERPISVPYRGGGVVDFAPSRLQSFEGRVSLARNGASQPAEYAGFEIDLSGRIVQSVVGKGGLFYFENLPEGSWPARIFLDGGECRFVLRVPRRNQMIVDLGEIRCEVGN